MKVADNDLSWNDKKYNLFLTILSLCNRWRITHLPKIGNLGLYLFVNDSLALTN